MESRESVARDNGDEQQKSDLLGRIRGMARHRATGAGREFRSGFLLFSQNFPLGSDPDLSDQTCPCRQYTM